MVEHNRLLALNAESVTQDMLSVDDALLSVDNRIGLLKEKVWTVTLGSKCSVKAACEKIVRCLSVAFPDVDLMEVDRKAIETVQRKREVSQEVERKRAEVQALQEEVDHLETMMSRKITQKYRGEGDGNAEMRKSTPFFGVLGMYNSSVSSMDSRFLSNQRDSMHHLWYVRRVNDAKRVKRNLIVQKLKDDLASIGGLKQDANAARELVKNACQKMEQVDPVYLQKSLLKAGISYTPKNI